MDTLRESASGIKSLSLGAIVGTTLLAVSSTFESLSHFFNTVHDPSLWTLSSFARPETLSSIGMEVHEDTKDTVADMTCGIVRYLHGTCTMSSGTSTSHHLLAFQDPSYGLRRGFRVSYPQ